MNLRKFRFSRDEPSPGLGVSYNEGDKRILMVIFFSLFLNLIRSSFHMQMRSAETFGRSIPATFYKKPSAVRHPGGRGGKALSIHSSSYSFSALHFDFQRARYFLLVDCVGKMSAVALGGGI